MWAKISVLCWSAFPLNNHWDMHLQNGLVFCISSRVSNLSAVRDLGVGPVSGEMLGVTSGGAVELMAWWSCLVWLLVLKAGPSIWVTVSMLIIVGVAGSCSTNLERQPAALFLAPEIHLNIMLYVASSSPHLLTLLLVFFHLRILQGVCSHFSLWYLCPEYHSSI